MKRRTFNQTLLQATLISPLVEYLCKPAPEIQRIGLICPGSPIDETKFATAIENCQLLGIQPIYTDRIHLKHGYLAGPDEERLADLHEMYLNPEVDAIWCIRGGYGCTRLLPYINFELIKKNPKPLIGYSDVTALLNAIHQKTEAPAIHGPVASSKLTDYSRKMLEPLITNNPKSFSISLHRKLDSDYRIITPGKMEGKLCGGNLSLVASMVGTPYQINPTQKIVFLEDIGESPYRLDRMFTQLISSGFFNDVTGIILGEFVDCDAPFEDSLSIQEIIFELLSPLQIPTVYGFSFGHIADQCSFPIGVPASMNTNNPVINLHF